MSSTEKSNIALLPKTIYCTQYNQNVAHIELCSYGNVFAMTIDYKITQVYKYNLENSKY